jgi:hypothetical protein
MEILRPAVVEREVLGRRDQPSGDVAVEGAPVEGTSTKHKVAGSVRGGGPLIKASSKSGAIRVRVAP